MQAELRPADAWGVLPVCPLGHGPSRIACRAMADELCCLGARGAGGGEALLLAPVQANQHLSLSAITSQVVNGVCPSDGH